MTYSPLEVRIEEFQQATWVAELVSDTSFGSSGSFQLNDGSTWQGASVIERYDVYRYYTTVVGGAGKLGVVIPDKFYSGNVSLQIAVQDVCSACGESVGNVTAGLFLSTFQRQQGTASVALDAIASAFGLIWWIDRSGLVNMSAQRPVGAEASGTRTSSDVDASIVLTEPLNVTLGAAYDLADSLVQMPVIQHVRWKQNSDKFSAQLYPLPFLFKNPVQTVYDCMYDATVQQDHGDGTGDFYVDNRFFVTCRLFCGVPGAKVTMDPGDVVAVGFFGGNPQAPFAMGMAQNSTAIKKVARNTDPIIATLAAADITALALMLKVGAGPALGSTIVATPTDLPLSGTCQINGGTSRISVGD
jgi:hypothetical protein